MKHFTADLHFDMPSFLNRQPFKTMEEHDAAILDDINYRVARHDILYVLGDMCMSNRWAHFRNKIRCRTLIHVIGNHDRASMSQHTHKSVLGMPVKLGSVPCWLSHYAHAYWPASHKGSLHLYGHCHAQREETLDMVFPGRRSMDCGLDNAKRLLGYYRPFSEVEILERIGNNPGHDLPSFYKGSYK